MREAPLTGGRNASEVVRVGGTVRRASDPGSASAAELLGYLAWAWRIQTEGGVPVDAQAAHLRELRDADGPVPPEVLIDAMARSQDRIVRHSEQAVHGSRDPAARRAWADEAIKP